MVQTLQSIVGEWKQCNKCGLGKDAQHHVILEQIEVGYGNISLQKHVAPIDAMIIGEGPGVSENVIGRPFIGASGSLLRSALVQANIGSFSWAVTLTNLLACRPWAASPQQPENRAPVPAEVECCAPRLVSLLRLQRPKLVISAGNVPAQYMLHILRSSQHTCKYFQIRHPAWIIRQQERDLHMKVYIQSIKEAFNVIYR